MIKLAPSTWAIIGATAAGATAVGVGVALRKRRAALLWQHLSNYALGRDADAGPVLSIGKGPRATTGGFPDNAELAAFVAAMAATGPEFVHDRVDTLAGYADTFNAGPAGGGASNEARWREAIGYQRQLMSGIAWKILSYGLSQKGFFKLDDRHIWYYEDAIPAFVRWQVEEHRADLRDRMLKLAQKPGQNEWGRLQYGQRSIAESWSLGGVNWIAQTARGQREYQLIKTARTVELPGILEAMLWARAVPYFLLGPIPAPSVDWGDVFAMAGAWLGAAVTVATAGAAGGLTAAGAAAYTAAMENA